MKDLFPGVKAERVKKLLQTPDFQARQALADLSSEMTRMQKDGVDLTRLQALLKKAYTPARLALGENLTKAGWNNEEQGAAHMAEEGRLKIK